MGERVREEEWEVEEAEANTLLERERVGLAGSLFTGVVRNNMSSRMTLVTEAAAATWRTGVMVVIAIKDARERTNAEMRMSWISRTWVSTKALRK